MKKFSRKTNAILLGAVTSIWFVPTTRAGNGTYTNTAGPVQQGQSDGGTGNPSLNNPAGSSSITAAPATNYTSRATS